jgi:hypothetical protein
MGLPIDLSPEEIDLVVSALRIQLERWQDALVKKMGKDANLSHITMDSIRDGIRRHEELLKRFPRGTSNL